MNKRITVTGLVLIFAFLVFSCRESVKAESVPISTANSSVSGEKYTMDAKESVVMWKGSNAFGSNFHTGYIYVSDGNLMIDNDLLVAGSARIDMNTIQDEKRESDNGLVKHLKDPDFFDVNRFPVSIFEITNVESDGENAKVTANLTIKEITHSVTFPTRVEIKDGIAKMTGRLIIDRTQWDIRYKSGRFYANLADETISDYIEFNIAIVAKK
ncbi:MAG: YceI family protein [Flavobacterium sp.]|uniref:YceI family protein n=1 Tax=Flavobacterium sp. TaxID=239 RepID=UPI0012052C95|nr:YceI family protein [Flavobacterium sp.]RZJ66324.1 MAG: YceI family protein [Flavobacterium sp.]